MIRIVENLGGLTREYGISEFTSDFQQGTFLAFFLLAVFIFLHHKRCLASAPPSTGAAQYVFPSMSGRKKIDIMLMVQDAHNFAVGIQIYSQESQ